MTSRAAKLFEQRLHTQRQQHDATAQLHKALQEDTRTAMFHKWETQQPATQPPTTTTPPTASPPVPSASIPSPSPPPTQSIADRRALLTQKALALANASEQARQQLAKSLHQQRLRNECDALRTHSARQRHQDLANEWRHQCTTAAQRRSAQRAAEQKQQAQHLEELTTMLERRHAADVQRAADLRAATITALEEQLSQLEASRAADRAAADAEAAALRAMWDQQAEQARVQQQQQAAEKRAQSLALAEACHQQQAFRAQHARQEAAQDAALVEAACRQEAVAQVVEERLQRLRAQEMQDYRRHMEACAQTLAHDHAARDKALAHAAADAARAQEAQEAAYEAARRRLLEEVLHVRAAQVQDKQRAREHQKQENRAWQLHLEAEAAAFTAEQREAQEREAAAQAAQRACLDAQVREHAAMIQQQEAEEEALLARQRAVQDEFDRHMEQLVGNCTC